MHNFNRLELQHKTRPYERFPSGASKTERHFLDFVVDGISLYGPAQADGLDLISCLWLPTPDPAIISRLLGDTAPDLPQERCMLYVCAECGDARCGSVSIRLEVLGDRMVWHDFAYQGDYNLDEVWPLDAFAHLQPLTFDLSEYRALLTSVLKSQ